MTDDKVKVMMQGSEGNLDYLVAVEIGKAAIGVKPVIEAVLGENQEPKILIGVRIRLAAFPGEDILNAEHIANMVCPIIPWQKKAADRCSVFLGSLVPPFPDKFIPDELISTLEESEFFDKIMECVSPVYEVEKGLVVADADEVLAYIKETFRTTSAYFLKKAGPTVIDESKVVPFKPTLQ